MPRVFWALALGLALVVWFASSDAGGRWDPDGQPGADAGSQWDPDGDAETDAGNQWDPDG